MYLISFLLVINSFVVTPVNQKLVFRPSFLTSTELESLTVHLSHLRDLTASVQESGSQSGIYKIHNEKEKLAKYRLVLQNEFEKQRRFLASKGLLSAIPRVDATEKEITGKFNELGKAIDNQDFEKVSSLLKYATPPPFPVDTQPPYQMLEPGKRIEPVKEGKRGIRTGPPTPDDTLPTIDVRITPEIKALAQQLGYDPRKIYEYVKNNVNYDPFYGSMKGSLGALYEQYGNDIDQASLLIALLRASGIPSRYVRGVITLSPSGAANMLGVVSRKRIIPTLLRSRIPFTPNTIGDSLVSVDMEYVWVRAYIPIQHYMGIPTGDERGKVWLPMFPAFKKLKITEGINLPEAMGFDFEEFFKDFIVNNPEAKTPIELYREKLTNYLNQNYPGKTYEEILLKEGVIEEKFQTLPLTSPVKVKYITDEFAEVPDGLRHKLTLEVKATYSNNQYLIQTIPMPTVFSRRFTLDYAPATSEDSAIVSEYGGIMQTPPYLIELKPVVRIGGKIVAIGSPIGSSFIDCQLTLICSIKEPGHQLRTTAAAIRGNTAGLGMFQSPTDRILTNPPAESLDTDGAAAANMYICLADYFPKTAKDRDEINRTIQARVANYYTFGIVSNQLALGGAWEPLSTQWVGLYIDVPLIRILASPIKGEYDIKDPILGMNGSYWENMVFENRYEVPAISSAKGFRVADSLGIPIYKVNLSGISNLFGERGGKPAGRAAVKSSTPSMMTPPVRMSLEKVEDEVIVRFTRKVGKRGMKETLDKIISGTEVLKTSHRTNAVLVKLPAHLSRQSAVQTLKSNPNVLYTEPNYRYAAQSIAPDDPFFENEWGIRKCLINAAWDSTTGDSSIIIAFLDTGVDTLHPDLVNRIIPGYDFVNEDSFAYDDQGHGTMVAGVIGAEANNSIGIAGIDWQAKLLPVKVLNELGVGTVFDAAEGIYYAIEKNARILNLSLGGYDPSSYLAEAVDSAYNSGCVIIGGAGNDGTSQPFYPAAYPNVIGVSATKENDLIAYFSNYGDYIDVSAPGVNIYTTERESGYLIASGTSMSCAYVSGVVGLLLGDNPLLTNVDIYNILKERSDDLGSPGWDGFYGYGRVNAYRALVGDIVIKPVIAGYEISGGNLNGYAEAGETFDVNLTLRNAGDSTAYDVSGLLTCADSNVTILADSGYYGDLEPEGTETVAYRISFSSSMPKGSVVKFTLNITASGFGFTEEWTIKEGDLLSILNISDASKEDIRNYINQGFDMYVPQSAYVYDHWAGEHYFGYNSKTYAGGWWIRGRCFGGATAAGVDDWASPWLRIFKKGCKVVSIIPEILEPADSTVYHKGDSLTLSVKYIATFECPETTSVDTIYEDYVIDTKDLSPKRHTLYAKGRDSQGHIVTDSSYIWVFTFNIKENLVTKYFNPLKPDSAKIKFEIKPKGYIHPDTLPNPINMQVEIRDKDSILVRGPRDLTYNEKKYQVLYWDGKDNWGQVVDVNRGPFKGNIALEYGGGREETWKVYRSFKTSALEIEIANVFPVYRKFVPVRGESNDIFKFNYKITPTDLPIQKREMMIYGNGCIYTEELSGDSGVFEWDGKCTASSPLNEVGHYADPRENPYYVVLRVTLEGNHYVIFQCIDDLCVVPQIDKVIGTHTPFAPDASCDEDHSLDLTITCVLKGKIDDTGNESENMLYYTEGEVQNLAIWDGASYYENDTGYNGWPSYFIEMLETVKGIDFEIWDTNLLGNLDYKWEWVHGPEVIIPDGWQSHFTFKKPGTYQYNITVKNYCENDTFQIGYSPGPKIKSEPSHIPQYAKENTEDCYMIHLKGPENDTYGWAQSFLTVPYGQIKEGVLPVDYHYICCSSFIHAAEWLNGWRDQSRGKVGPYIRDYSDSLEVLNPDYDVGAERNDWVVIDRKRDMDGDGKIGEDPPGDMNRDSLPGFAGVDDDGDNLIDEDSWGRQPWEPFYTNDLMSDDDEDGRFEDGEIVGLDEDPGGFEGGWKWEHIMLLKEYYWVDWTQYGNEDYIKTQGHIYAFIHAHGGKPGSVEEGPGHDQFRYPIIFAWDHPYEPGEKKIWNILFRIPRRP